MENIKCTVRIQVGPTSHKSLVRDVSSVSVSDIAGWPKLQWFVTEHLSKLPKDWLPPARQSDEAPAYIEVTLNLITSATLNN